MSEQSWIYELGNVTSGILYGFFYYDELRVEPCYVGRAYYRASASGNIGVDNYYFHVIAN